MPPLLPALRACWHPVAFGREVTDRPVETLVTPRRVKSRRPSLVVGSLATSRTAPRSATDDSTQLGVQGLSKNRPVPVARAAVQLDQWIEPK